MGAVKSQLETSHQDELNELTASFLAETAIKVETTRLETEHEWQEKLEATKQKYEEELQTMAGKLFQVSRRCWKVNILCILFEFVMYRKCADNEVAFTNEFWFNSHLFSA